ncbi:MAG: tyrosine-protein phosphatase [Solirubrobacteraceae bacterium]
MIDLHCHVLPGIDDGPASIEGSLALARAAAAAGIATLVATPHIDAKSGNDAARVAHLVALVNERLLAEGIPVEVLPGGEIAATHLPELPAAELARLGLGGSSALLIEFPFSPVIHGLPEALGELRHAGHRIVLAHPERCPAFHGDRRTLHSLADAGVLMSVTAGSLIGRFGSQVRKVALELAREGLMHNVTSDAHDHARRRPGLREELLAAKLGELAEWLTELVPAAILADAPIPPRPHIAPSRRRVPRWLGARR